MWIHARMPGVNQHDPGVFARALRSGFTTPATYDQAAGRVAQWESARFTRERSLVRNQPRPSSVMGTRAGFFTSLALRARWKPAAPNGRPDRSASPEPRNQGRIRAAGSA